MNINDMRDDLAKVFEALRDNKIDHAKAAEMNNTAGRVLSALKIQLAYHAMREEQPDIGFIGDGTTTRVGPQHRLPAAKTIEQELVRRMETPKRRRAA